MKIQLPGYAEAEVNERVARMRRRKVAVTDYAGDAGIEDDLELSKRVESETIDFMKETYGKHDG